MAGPSSWNDGMPFNFMFSSSGLNAFERSIEIYLFGLAFYEETPRG